MGSSNGLLLVPTVPFATTSLVLLPIVLGILVLSLPFFLPVMVVLLTAAADGLSLFFSSRKGHKLALIIFGLLHLTFLSTVAGQYAANPVADFDLTRLQHAFPHHSNVYGKALQACGFFSLL